MIPETIDKLLAEIEDEKIRATALAEDAAGRGQYGTANQHVKTVALLAELLGSLEALQRHETALLRA